MTRRVVYGLGMLLTVACTIMTIVSIATPRWISYAPNDKRVASMGLHSYCSKVTGACERFPKYKDCEGDKWGFCSMWRTVGFLMSFAVVIELCTVVSFIVIIAGGVQRRTQGWQVMCSILLVGGVIQCAGMAIVAFLFDHDDRFFSGWYLDSCFTLCTASWTTLVLTSVGIAATAMYLPEEGDYELIPDEQVEITHDDQFLSRISGWNDGYQNERNDSNYWSNEDSGSIKSNVTSVAERR
ncbi:hypothetical protein P154DRAFT_500976 [Amniculicola lignicola CBS 123094]|uniref:Uncharacterized protein n=1 Tax=Amniculicola lignicola CBS 123094 TaxID=1392246 RepID=A0A6A5W777_9PLEO|nr:hypothetical protein P154DRAFT_500976 [Amniculicola lignicola CBS 123094]